MENPETVINIPSPAGPDLTDIIQSMPPTSERGSSVVGNQTRLCPLCNAAVRLFYINLQEKMLMCANAECEFPFGHEELVFVKFDETNKTATEQDSTSIRSKRTQETLLQETPNGSVISEGCWSDIDKIDKVLCCNTDDTELSSFEFKAVDPKEYMNSNIAEKPPTPSKKDDNIKENLEKIKQIDKKLQEFQEPGKKYIKNRKLLKQLRDVQRDLQEKFRNVRLLRPEELSMIRNDQPTTVVGPPVKVDIQTNKDNLPTININIETTKEEGKAEAKVETKVKDEG